MNETRTLAADTIIDISKTRISQEKLKALFVVSLKINQISNVEALLNEIMHLAIANIGAERGLIILADESGEIYHTLASDSLDEGEITFSRSIVQETLKSGEVLLSIDVQHDERFKDSKSVKEFNILSFVCIPLFARNYNYPLGTLYVDQRMHKRTFTNDDIAFLKAFTNLAAIAISNANLIEKLRSENIELRGEVSKKYDFPGIVGEGKAMQEVFSAVKQIMNDDCTVLITGESGSGKEVIAKAIHYNGNRRDKPFVAINCGALPDTLLEAELFGSVRGAFTGAVDKQGLFQAATGGTLFLDEIHHTSEAMQIKLLRVLQEKEIRRVGSTRSIKVNVRLICATNEDLQAAIKNGKFRKDFYYRINVVTIEIPPLRKRREDIPILADQFMKRLCRAKKKRCKGFSKQALEALMQYDWRENNVRELENEVERIVIFTKDNAEVQLHDLSSKISSGNKVISASLDEVCSEREGLPVSFKEFEKRYIEFVLRQVDGNRTKAAKIMRIPRPTLLGKIRRLGIQ